MSSFVESIILCCTYFLAITTSQWNQSPILLPRASCVMAAGSSNGSIFLIGNHVATYCSTQFLEFVITNAESDPFIDYGCSLQESSHGEGDFYIQVSHLLYFIDPYSGTYTPRGMTLSFFNTITKTFTTSWANIPVSVHNTGCLTSHLHYLYVVGGYNEGTESILNLVQVLNTNTMTWIDNVPSMNLKRNRPSCIVDPFTSKLYAIGGNDGVLGYFSSYHDTIEQINTNNILQGSWEFITDTLTDPAIEIRSVIYRQMIYMIGGEYNNGNAWIALNTVHILDPTTDTISLSPERLPYSEATGAAIIDDDVLYVFGGSASGIILKTWMKYYFPTSSPSSITSVPSSSPTQIPTSSPTNIPTASPTNIPTTSPTQITSVPTSSPTNIPSSAPTNIPTISPTYIPSTSPTAITSVPTVSPTNIPTEGPTDIPTSSPTNIPTSSPTEPTNVPSLPPTDVPTSAPSKHPTYAPSVLPTRLPTSDPTLSPTQAPTNIQTVALSDVAISTTKEEHSKGDKDDINAAHSNNRSIGVIVAICSAICIFVSICGLYIMHLKRKIIALQTTAAIHSQEDPGAAIVNDIVLNKNKIIEESNPPNILNENMEGDVGEESKSDIKGSFIAEGQNNVGTTCGEECNYNINAPEDDFIVLGNDD